MRRLLGIALLSFVAFAAPLYAGCGSSSCPLDLNALNLPHAHRFSLDLSLQYIDQDQPRIGTHDAAVGEIHGHHDEVRTINRITTATLTYAATERVHVTASLPFVSRAHEHLESDVVPEAWDIHGVGDLSLVARANVWRRLWLIGGAKLPTGADDRRNEEGELGELPIQPGSGTTDAIAGVAWQSEFARRVPRTSDYATAAWFASATYQRRGSRDDYRLGNELQLNAGAALPLTKRLEALAQLNGRIRERDRAADPEEAELTGGTFVYASPGLRWSLGGASLYVLAQLPVYQRVNAIQLTSRTNWVAGVQTRF